MAWAEDPLQLLAEAIDDNDPVAFATVLRDYPRVDLTARVGGETLLWRAVSPERSLTVERRIIAEVVISRQPEIFKSPTAIWPHDVIGRLLFAYDTFSANADNARAQDVQDRINFLLQKGGSLENTVNEEIDMPHVLIESEKWHAMLMLAHNDFKLNGLYGWKLSNFTAREQVSLIAGQVRRALAEKDNEKMERRLDRVEHLVRLGADLHMPSASDDMDPIYVQVFKELVESYEKPDSEEIVARRDRAMTILQRLSLLGMNWSALLVMDRRHYYPGAEQTMLTAAAEMQLVPLVRRLLRANVDVNATNRRGENALMIAVRKRNFELATMLLDAGININWQNNDPSLPTALHNAVASIEMGGDLEETLKMIELLLERGLDYESANNVRGLEETVMSLKPRRSLGLAIFRGDDESDKFAELEEYFDSQRFRDVIARSEPMREAVRKFHAMIYPLAASNSQNMCSMAVTPDLNRVFN